MIIGSKVLSESPKGMEKEYDCKSFKGRFRNTIDNDQIKNAVKKVLISPTEGLEGYAMREFELG